MKKVNDYKYEVEKQGDMNVPATFYINDKLRDLIEEKTIQQTINMATLPGILKHSIAMPDAHMGYGFPVGGVAAFDAEEGVISPGGIGFDINCGIRVLASNFTRDEVLPKIQELLQELFDRIPCGVGRSSELKLTNEELEELLEKGPEWLVEEGYGREEDLKHCEANGRLKHADANKVSRRAKSRGRKQVGTLGGGNHFLEVQYVDKILDEEAAHAMGINQEGQVLIMIHSGSRGLGHQVCTDYLRKIEDSFPNIMGNLPDKDLAYAPINSQMAKDYFGAMCAAAHFAWSNRHLMGHHARKAFQKVLGDDGLYTVYDVAHNIAKLEEYEIDGEKKKAYVHRKGATRAFPPGHPEIPEDYKDVGQPVLIPGSMGTSSYILTGTRKGMNESFGSTCHGAGRVMSRREATRRFDKKQIEDELEQDSIYVKSASKKGVTEEAPGAYKDVDEVIKVVEKAGIAKPAVQLRPLGVIKG